MVWEIDTSFTAGVLPISKHLSAAWSLVSLLCQHMRAQQQCPSLCQHTRECQVTGNFSRHSSALEGFHFAPLQENQSGALLPESWDEQTCPCFIAGVQMSSKTESETEPKLLGLSQLQSHTGKASHPCPSHFRLVQGTTHWAQATFR